MQWPAPVNLTVARSLSVISSSGSLLCFAGGNLARVTLTWLYLERDLPTLSANGGPEGANAKDVAVFAIVFQWKSTRPSADDVFNSTNPSQHLTSVSLSSIVNFFFFIPVSIALSIAFGSATVSPLGHHCDPSLLKMEMTACAFKGLSFYRLTDVVQRNFCLMEVMQSSPSFSGSSYLQYQSCLDLQESSHPHYQAGH